MSLSILLICKNIFVICMVIYSVIPRKFYLHYHIFQWSFKYLTVFVWMRWADPVSVTNPRSLRSTSSSCHSHLPLTALSWHQTSLWDGAGKALWPQPRGAVLPMGGCTPPSAYRSPQQQTTLSHVRSNHRYPCCVLPLVTSGGPGESEWSVHRPRSGNHPLEGSSCRDKLCLYAPNTPKALFFLLL